MSQLCEIGTVIAVLHHMNGSRLTQKDYQLLDICSPEGQKQFIDYVNSNEGGEYVTSIASDEAKYSLFKIARAVDLLELDPHWITKSYSRDEIDIVKAFMKVTLQHNSKPSLKQSREILCRFSSRLPHNIETPMLKTQMQQLEIHGISIPKVPPSPCRDGFSGPQR